MEDFSLKRVSPERQIPVEERTLDNYYCERLFSADTVLHTMIAAVERASPEGSLFGLLETFNLAHSAALDRLGEVEEYIKQLEAKVAAPGPGSSVV